MSHKPAGGLHSKNVVHHRAPKAEPKPYAKRPAGVAQIGNLVGDHVTNRDSTGYKGERMDRGRGYSPPVGPTDNVAACGVGGGRTIHSCGSQGLQGSVNPGSPRPNTYREALEQE
jgi:hypothetical protein